jgi:hypothetical protein
MRTSSTSLFISTALSAAFCLLSGTSGFAQTTVVPPSDPLEPVTGAAQTVTSVEQRAGAVALLNHAADFYAMHTKGTPAHILQMSFNATASTLFPGGSGQLRETWISGQNWRWDATLGNYSLLRISSNGVAYDQQNPQPIPLRIKMLANAVFAPLQFISPRVAPMRLASVTWKGAQVTCILLNPEGNAVASAAASPATGRSWSEREFCIDPSTGLLAIYSEAPGIYVFYDYSNALKFHDRILPGAVTVNENGVAVVQAQLTSVTDTDQSNVSPFTPTAQMKEQGPAVVLFAPMRMNRVTPLLNLSQGTRVEPVVVHVTLDQQGNVQESEVLQTNSESAQALALVAQTKLWPVPEAGGTPPRQREAYVRVEFVSSLDGVRFLRGTR